MRNLFSLLFIAFVLSSCAQQSGTFNVKQKGSGSPVVVFESGLGDPLSNWSHIQKRLSKNVASIAYDRHGLGKTPANGKQRTVDYQAAELQLMLEENGIDGPIILVAHSLGGLIARKYQQLHPQQVVGMLLIDPTHELFYQEMYQAMGEEAADSMQAALDAQFNSMAPGISQEWKGFPKSCQMMNKMQMPADIPVRILASWKQDEFQTPERLEIKKRLFADWAEDKENVSIKGSDQDGHYIYYDNADWVLEEILEMIEEVE